VQPELRPVGVVDGDVGAAGHEDGTVGDVLAVRAAVPQGGHGARTEAEGVLMGRQMDDDGVKPLPKCQMCSTRTAVWLVSMAGGSFGFGAARFVMCTACAKAKGGKRRALKPRDY
jgi:hypothetical protein